MNNERAAVWTSLAATKGVGTKSLVRLAITLQDRGIDASELRRVAAPALIAFGLTEKQAVAAEASLADDRSLESSGSTLLVPGDSAYPAHRLSDSPVLPVLLRANGQLSVLDDPAVAFSGSRNASPAVQQFVRSLASILASDGTAIVSGNAKGVDACAHQSAADACTATVAVLAEGLSSFTPSWTMNEEQAGWLAISQFADSARWQSHHAMSRNETIAALSDVVVVAAAGDSGGSLAMGRMCLKTGHPVAVPEISKAEAPGNRLLLEEGATALPFDDVEAAATIVRSLMSNHGASHGATTHQEALFE